MSRSSTPRVARGRAHALPRRLHREEDGQTFFLEAGLICIVLALLSVAASATAVYLDLKTLISLADSTAATGADGVKARPYYGGDVTDDTPGSLTDIGVGSKAAGDLSAQPATTRPEGVMIVSVWAADSHTAEVRPQAHSRPPFLPWEILPAEGFTITTTGSARMTTT